MVGTSKIRYFHTKGKTKKLVRLACHGNVGSIAHYVVKDPALRSRVVTHLSKLLKNELRRLSSDKHHSILREISSGNGVLLVVLSVARAVQSCTSTSCHSSGSDHYTDVQAGTNKTHRMCVCGIAAETEKPKDVLCTGYGFSTDAHWTL